EVGAEEYSASLMGRARTRLGQARNLAAQNRTKGAMDYSRRTATLSAQALQMTIQQKEAEALAAEIARRQAETADLESRASAAEASTAAAVSALAEANRAIEEANRATEEAGRQRVAAEAAVLGAQQELTRIESEKAELQVAVTALGLQARSLEDEKARLSTRLAGALSEVAETRSSARGMILNLPDILFDNNQATLKTEARIVLAKLAGILLIMPELNLRVEGHTDSTGSADHNQQLSERRAISVRDFLAQQGIAAQRTVAVGYGFGRPVADNSTREGRAKNRRVEIIIGEGEIVEEKAPAP
ncbi:MAG: OmpA family protein, partial [Thermoanaerobaculales bacterium]